MATTQNYYLEEQDTRTLLSNTKFFESYSRYNKDNSKYEVWDESVARVMDMHKTFFKDKLEKVPELNQYFQYIEDAYKNKRILGAQRSLQFGGDQLLQHHMRIYNCTSSHLDRPAFFGEYFYILLCGAGAGYSVQKHHIAKLPMIRPRTKQAKIHTIDDTIEGWATALNVLLSSYFIGGGVHPEYEGRRVHFEFHKIRPKGSAISGGFKAPGAEPLKRALDRIETLLNSIAEDGILRPIDAYDICCHTADAVLSGGVRRAATICLFSKDDEEMIKAKTGNWNMINPQRARSNNSAVIKRDEITYEEFQKLVAVVREFGEPGFVFVSSYEHCFNPCITEDSWIDTNLGLKQVKELIGVPFYAIVDGQEYESKKGFWKTGKKEVFEIETFRGYKVKATDNHKILIERNKERVWLEVKDLKIGDKMVINENLNLDIEINRDEKDLGWLLGEVVGDGCHNPEKYNSLVRFWGNTAKTLSKKAESIFAEKFPSLYSSRNAKPVFNKLNDTYTISNKPFTDFCSLYLEPGTKNIKTEMIGTMSNSFIAGFISGLFDSDGTINWSKSSNSRSIRLTQNNLNRLEMIQILLSKIGIASSIYKDRHPNKSWENYDSKPIHELHISRNCMDRFAEIVGFCDPNKHKKMNEMLNSRRRVAYRDKFISEIINIKSIGVETVYDCTVENIHCFSANGMIVHNCVEIGMLPKTKKGVSGWQGCVKGDTKLLTKTGIVNIGDVIDKEVEIWNGKKWSKVKPFITGYDRNFYRVNFGDGSYLDCTENHKFLVKNRFDKEYKEMTTLDLLHDVGKYTMHVPRSNIIMSDENRKDVDHDYDYGFILGDGTVRQNKSSATAIVYEHYFNRNFPVTGKLQSERVCKYKGNKVKTYYWNKGDLDLEFAYDLKYGSELPSEMFSQWSRKSLLNFFAGWIDTDGSVGKTGCRIYGTEGHIRSAQLLLSMMGINSSVNLQSKRGIKTNFGVRNRDVWYLQITETKDLYSYKKEIVSGVLTKKGKYQTIKSIIPLSGKETSYCFEEKEEHCGVFNNVLTKQCNLVEMNGSLCPNPEAFYHACMCASALATLQAAYTDFKFVGPETKEIFDREALIGVSLTGWMNSPDILFDKEVLKKGAMIVRETNEKVAKLLGINPAARTTCVKPAGNASVLLGTASGIHPEHARKYIRNIQVNKQQEVASIIRTMNPYMVEESVWSEGNADYIISFPVIPPKGSIVKSQLTGVDFLERVKLVQENWIEHGTNEELCVDKTVRHNVSNTVTVKENEWDAVSKYLFDNRNSFTGVSMISETGDKDYYQAPNIEVLSADEISKKWGPAAFFASGLIVESTKGFKNLWEATAIAQSNDDDSSQELKDIRAEWIRRFKKFALNYFGSDLKKTEYCLKDVYILHKWMKIQTNFVDINLSEHLHEMKETDIDTMGAQACYAGACEVR